MKSLARSLIVVLAVMAVPAYGAVLSINSSFATGLDGWTGINNSKLDWISSGGPDGGGYLQWTDLGDGWGTIVAPSKFVGDLREFDEGVLAFDYKVFTYGDGLMQYNPIIVKLVTGARTYEYTVATAAEVGALGTTDWHHFEVSMTAAAWGVTEFEWELILRNVKGIQIAVEPAFNSKKPYDVIGVGGIILQSKDDVGDVPEPATLTLMGMGALALLRRRCRK
ncbi:MAG: PEP-CTERM sorting domain-containing protein [Phycisphaerae bacterium]|nr:PEP-CTERM sorting domain-containing protein [Phycisphaerae bacterium]